MALEESIDGLEKIEANGVSAYIDPNLKAFLNQFGSINVDFIQREVGSSGFTIKVGSGDSGCSSCGSASEGCG